MYLLFWMFECFCVAFVCMLFERLDDWTVLMFCLHVCNVFYVLNVLFVWMCLSVF